MGFNPNVEALKRIQQLVRQASGERLKAAKQPKPVQVEATPEGLSEEQEEELLSGYQSEQE